MVVWGATARVVIRGDGRRLAAATLQPGQRLNGPLGHFRTQLITMVQSTEPATLRVSINLDYVTRPRRRPCLPPDSRVRMKTTSHSRG